jgi:GH15 family glucan-1,4-alpha-glucosidase
MKRFTFTSGRPPLHVHEETVSNHKPYYAFWVYKIYHSDRFDLLGNSLALLSGLASPSRSAQIVTWVEAQCDELRHTGDLVGELPPNFFPYIRPGEPDWLPRYQRFNKPGEYHNGGIWPFVGGFYVAALVAAGKMPLARKKLLALAGAARLTRVATAGFGFNEWIKAQTGEPLGQDWQSWSAASFLYASACVETEVTPFFNFIRA